MPSDWEDRFATWGKPPSQTERDKCDNTERAVRSAINKSEVLARRTVQVFTQGSYRNRTNVREDSDVDICVLCKDSFFFELPQGFSADSFSISTPAAYAFSQFKTDVNSALLSQFGTGAVERGNKAFDVHENTYRIAADVVAAFEYRYYAGDGSYREGAAFNTDGGVQIINYPEQSYSNGVAKNDATGQRFKTIVRILKRLRGQMESDGVQAARGAASFLIESMVWNVPNEGFGHSALSADIRWALAHLYNGAREDSSCSEWTEVNGFKYLFRPSQPWTRLRAHNFVSAAWDYIGYQ
jgi:hypothetical protein